MTRTQMDCVHAIKQLGVALHEEGQSTITQIELAQYIGYANESVILRIALAYLQGMRYVKVEHRRGKQSNVITFNWPFPDVPLL